MSEQKEVDLPPLKETFGLGAVPVADAATRIFYPGCACILDAAGGEEVK